MISQSFLPELQHEAASCRKMLERVPLEKYSWKPHDKSMTLGRLATHVAELPSWITMTINTDELDFSKFDYKPFEAKSTEELLRHFDENVERAAAALKDVDDATMMKNWTLRNGDHIIFTMPKVATIRSMAMNHMIHHRGQLSVYLRLAGVPVPGMYGPSADEM
jgi:uncharacterized damage-inducible protein DinB